jgi:hypothetical protein
VAFTCPRCHHTSHNPNDEAAGYCGSCHTYREKLLEYAAAVNKAMTHRVVPMLDGRPLYYVLEPDGTAKPWEGPIEGWGERMALLGSEKVLRTTDLPGGGQVITAFLGMDDAAATMRPSQAPAIFGTIVWGTHEEFFDATKVAALARHERVVEALRAGQALKGEYDQDQHDFEEASDEPQPA